MRRAPRLRIRERPGDEYQPAEEIRYLGVAETLACYSAVFECTEQQAADQLRSRDGLESALARPQFYAYYEDADLALQAAVLAHGIAESQPFIEGNKRTALAVLRTFLLANGYQVSASQTERFRWMPRLSEGAPVEELADRIRAALVRAGG